MLFCNSYAKSQPKTNYAKNKDFLIWQDFSFGSDQENYRFGWENYRLRREITDKKLWMIETTVMKKAVFQQNKGQEKTSAFHRPPIIVSPAFTLSPIFTLISESFGR